MAAVHESGIEPQTLPFRESCLRHARYYLDRLERANQLYVSGEHSQALRELDDHWENIERGFHWSRACAGRTEDALWLCSRFPRASVVLDRRLHALSRLQWCEAQADAATRLGDPSLTTKALGSMGAACNNLGQLERALGYLQGGAAHRAGACRCG